MNRLRVQLILAFTLVVLVAVGAIAFLIIQTTNTQFRQYITNSGMRASGSGLQQLVAYYEHQGSWDGVESLLGEGVFLSGPAGRPLPANARHRAPGPDATGCPSLADAGGRVVFDSAGRAEGRTLESREQVAGSDPSLRPTMRR